MILSVLGDRLRSQVSTGNCIFKQLIFRDGKRVEKRRKMHSHCYLETAGACPEERSPAKHLGAKGFLHGTCLL